MVELLPCPYCGGEAGIDRPGTIRASMKISCSDCGATVESGDVLGLTPPEAFAWNRRIEALSAQGEAEAVGYVTKDALQNFDANGTEIVDVMLYPKGTLRPENEMALYTRPAEQAVTEAVRAAIARIEKTMCPTFSSDAGDIGLQGRISKDDLDILQIAALKMEGRDG